MTSDIAQVPYGPSATSHIVELPSVMDSTLSQILTQKRLKKYQGPLQSHRHVKWKQLQDLIVIKLKTSQMPAKVVFLVGRK